MAGGPPQPELHLRVSAFTEEGRVMDSKQLPKARAVLLDALARGERLAPRGHRCSDPARSDSDPILSDPLLNPAHAHAPTPVPARPATTGADALP